MHRDENGFLCIPRNFVGMGSAVPDGFLERENRFPFLKCSVDGKFAVMRELCHQYKTI
jgi:hypothetical protein